MTTETKREWTVSDVFEGSPCVIKNSTRAFTLPGNQFTLCDYLNALEACADALDDVMGGTAIEDHLAAVAALDRATEALARLRALRDAP